MTHSYPPGAPAHNTGVAPIPRGPRPPYSPAGKSLPLSPSVWVSVTPTVPLPLAMLCAVTTWDDL